jgi:hypothetical protein
MQGHRKKTGIFVQHFAVFGNMRSDMENMKQRCAEDAQNSAHEYMSDTKTLYNPNNL